jgi:hypothetical protein
MRQEYEERLHLDTLRILRYVGHTVYMGIPTRKGFKKSKLTDYYPLPFDKEFTKKSYSKTEIERFFNKKEPVIENGKLRGYIDRNGKFEKA